MIRRYTILFVSIMLCASVLAQQADQSDAEVKLRTDVISKTLRCVVCQNQSIFDSNAPLAADMRRLVEERVRAGDTDDEVREYLRGSYGDFILMKPPFQASTILLWLGPLVFVLGVLFWFLRRGEVSNARSTVREISEEDRMRLDKAFHREAGGEDQ